MAISPDHRRMCDLLVKDVEGSNLGADEKNNLVSSLEGALESTNGLSPEDKLQSCCVTNFWLAANLTRLYLAVAKAPPPMSWKHLIRDCQFAIVLIVLILAVLLGFRPELGELLKSVATAL